VHRQPRGRRNPNHAGGGGFSLGRGSWERAAGDGRGMRRAARPWRPLGALWLNIRPDSIRVSRRRKANRPTPCPDQEPRPRTGGSVGAAPGPRPFIHRGRVELSVKAAHGRSLPPSRCRARRSDCAGAAMRYLGRAGGRNSTQGGSRGTALLLEQALSSCRNKAPTRRFRMVDYGRFLVVSGHCGHAPGLPGFVRLI